MSINLGYRPDDLTVHVLQGEPWIAGLRLVGYTWPAPPVVVFPNFSLTAELTESGALATWTMTEEQTLQLSNGPARLKVEGTTWWKGVSLCQP